MTKVFVKMIGGQSIRPEMSYRFYSWKVLNIGAPVGNGIRPVELEINLNMEGYDLVEEAVSLSHRLNISYEDSAALRAILDEMQKLMTQSQKTSYENLVLKDLEEYWSR